MAHDNAPHTAPATAWQRLHANDCPECSGSGRTVSRLDGLTRGWLNAEEDGPYRNADECAQCGGSGRNDSDAHLSAARAAVEGMVS
jgi:hypothetical protein